MYEGTSRQVISQSFEYPASRSSSKLAPQFNDALVQLIYRMVSKKPEDRPDSGEDVAAAARLAREGQAAIPAGAGGGSRVSGRRRVRRSARRRRR